MLWKRTRRRDAWWCLMFGSAGVHAAQTVFLLLLLMITVFALVARVLKISYPIVLVVAGLLISFVPHMPRIRLTPDLVFLIFLPPLLYASCMGDVVAGVPS